MKSLTDLATRGMVLLLANTVVRKSAGLITQLVLARLLLRADFGQYSLALTVVFLIGLFREHAFRDVLVQRQGEFDKWANPLFWLAITVASISAIGMSVAAPIVTTFYETANPTRVSQLIFILAASQVAQAFGVVSNAKLQIGLRFKSIATVEFFVVLVDATSKILLAALGFGSFSFVLAHLFFTTFKSMAFIYLAPFPLRLNPQFPLWRDLIPDLARVISTLYLYGLIQMGDYMVLGVFQPEAIVGLYYFAFTFSTQTASSLGSSLFQVLFPTLSKLTEEPQRQFGAFLRACRSMSTITIPICLAQAALGGPIIRLLFDSRWYDAIPILQILSICMSVQTVGGMAFTLMHAQGRFDLRFRLGIISVLIFFPLLTLGAYLGGAVGLAFSVWAFWSVMAIVNLACVLAPHGKPFSHIWSIFWPPMFGGLLAIGLGYLVAEVGLSALGPGKLRDILFIATTATISIPSYIMILRWASPESSGFLIDRLKTLKPSSNLTATPAESNKL